MKLLGDAVQKTRLRAGLCLIFGAKGDMAGRQIVLLLNLNHRGQKCGLTLVFVARFGQ